MIPVAPVHVWCGLNVSFPETGGLAENRPASRGGPNPTSRPHFPRAPRILVDDCRRESLMPMLLKGLAFRSSA